MALGKRPTERQPELFVTAADLPRSPGHVFYRKLNQLLAEAHFDVWVENLCEPFYATGRGRPGIPPGTYFRMLLVGYFEGIGTQRGIAWRCSDSLSLREFLAIPLTEDSPDHSSLSVIRQRLSLEVHTQVFQWILKLAHDKKLLCGTSVAVDSTTLEANAAMKSIVRRDTGEDWNEYLTRLMRQEGLVAADVQPSDDELRRFDRGRKNKKVGNDEWVSETDAESRITRMKDGTTHLAYKAEHVVDLASDVILSAEIYAGDHSDTQTLEDSLNDAQTNLREAGTETRIEEVAADKGYHANEQLTAIHTQTSIRTYIPEPESKHQRVWTDKPAEQKAAVYANRRRTRGKHGRELQRLRSEKVERTFAHVCETGGARRTWVRGREDVQKRYLIAVGAHNLGCVMRRLFRLGTPRGPGLIAAIAAAARLACLIAPGWFGADRRYLVVWQRRFSKMLRLLQPAA